jgi:membrane protease YdiL (CAAX protease family)
LLTNLQSSLDLEISEDTRANRMTFIVVIGGALLLYMFRRWGGPEYSLSSGIVNWVAAEIGGPFASHPEVVAYLYWGVTSLALWVLAPVVIIRWMIGGSPGEWGFRLHGIRRHFRVYGLMYLVMFPLLLWASSLPSFRSYYPFYKQAADGGSAFWLYEIGYAAQFVGVEAFFRGFLTFGLAKRFGLLGIVFMTLPYTMIHLGKPAPEVFGAVIAGLVLGYVALRAKSFVPGVFLHVGVALTMDLLVLWRAGALGNLL